MDEMVTAIMTGKFLLKRLDRVYVLISRLNTNERYDI